MKKPNPKAPLTDTPRAIEASGSFAGIDMPFKQAAAFETITATTGSEEFPAAAKVISIGLFVLGLDPAGDYCLHELTDALFGKGSEDSTDVYNSIVDAGTAAGDALANAQRARRAQTFTKAAEAVSA